MATVAELEKRLDRTDERISAMEASQSSMNEKMIRLDEKMNSFKTELSHMSDTMIEIKKDVKTLVQEPAKKWNNVSMTVITAIVSIVLGFLASHMLA